METSWRVIKRAYGTGAVGDRKVHKATILLAMLPMLRSIHLAVFSDVMSVISSIRISPHVYDPSRIYFSGQGSPAFKQCGVTLGCDGPRE
jgi:hypothetical protein